MDERLRILILDDKKKGDWESLLKRTGYANYLDYQIFTHLEKCLQFLHKNYTQLHVVLSDFLIEGEDNVVQYLADTAFRTDHPQTAAMGANVTLLTEGLRSKEGCTILVNRLYTTEDANLRNYSVESNLLFTYYNLDSPKILRSLKKTQIVHGMKSLLDEALEEVQRFFFTRAKSISEVQRKLHTVLSLDLAIDVRRSNLDYPSSMASILDELSKPSGIEKINLFRQEVGLLLEEHLEIYLVKTKTELTLPLSGLFPNISYQYHSYCKYSTYEFTPNTLRALAAFINELDGIQQLSRNKTQMFWMFLHNLGITRFLHTREPIAGSEGGKLNPAILRAADEWPLREIFGLRELLTYLSNRYVEISSDIEKKNAFVELF